MRDTAIAQMGMQNLFGFVYVTFSVSPKVLNLLTDLVFATPVFNAKRAARKKPLKGFCMKFNICYANEKEEKKIQL